MYEETKLDEVSAPSAATSSQANSTSKKKKKSKSPAKLAFNAKKVELLRMMVECKTAIGLAIPNLSRCNSEEELEGLLKLLPCKLRKPGVA